MFTGLIHSIGKIRSLRDCRESRVLEISHNLDDIPAKGASIAVNGVCLTVLTGQSDRFTAECFFATLNKTGLKNSRGGDRVHLEPALRMGSPLDGHLVQGHVQAVIPVLANRRIGRGRELTLKIPPEEEAYIIPEGSVALEGVSLTISSRSTGDFSVQLIGETLEQTMLGQLRTGDPVNLETDMILRARQPAAPSGNTNKQAITEQKLLQWGYL